MPYLQNINPEAIPHDGFHVARWHTNGKLWISIESWRNRADAEAMARDLRVSAHCVPAAGYFVWQAGDCVQDPRTRELV